MEISVTGHSEMGIYPSQVPAMSCISMYPKDALIYYKDTCPAMFTVALFIVARDWGQFRCSSTDEMIVKIWYICTSEYYSAVKENEIMEFVGDWMQPEKIILSEVTQTYRDKYYVFSLICGY